MALIAHWPLNGNTNDISGNGYNLISNGGSYASGKIGQAYLSDASVEYLYIPAANNNFQNIFNNNFSITFWYYTNTGTENTNRGLLQYGASGTDTLLHLLIRNTNYFAIGFYADDYNSSFAPTLGKWIHYTVIGDKDTRKQKLYINGQFYGERTATAWLNTANSPFYLAYYAGFYPNGLINDARVFNHALTDMEIQEIARAKILHYTFDDMQEPSTNLVNPTLSTWGLDPSGYTTLGTRTIISNYYCRIIDIDSNTRQSKVFSGISASKTYTASIKFKKIQGAPTLRFQIQQLDSGGINLGSLFPTTTQIGIQDIEDWQTAYYTFTTVANTVSLRWYIQDGNDYTGYTHIFELKEIQIEEKSYVTEFIAGSRTGRVNDYSGFFNHSDSMTEANTPRWTPEAKIGTGAYQFNGSNAVIERPMLSQLGYNSFTINMWVWFDESGVRDIMFGNFSSTNNFNFEKHTNNNLRFYWNGSPDILTGNVIPIGQWCMLTAVRERTSNTLSNIRMYVNGVSVYNQSGVTVNDLLSLNGTLRLGRDYRTTTEAMKGKLDDVRVYMEALSDKDIKDLYEARAEIEQSGVLYARDLVSNAEATVNLANTKIFGPNVDINGVPSGKYASNSSSYGFTISSVDSIESTGKSITASIYLRSQTDPASTYLFYVFTGTGPDGGWWNFGSGTLTRDWKRIVTTRSDINGPISSIRLYRQNRLGTMDYADLQLEMNDHVTPFASKYRPAIQLPSTLDFAGNEVHETGIANFEDFSTVGITDGLVGYWPLNYNSKDYSGNNYNGTSYGSMPILDNSTYFNGAITNYIQLPNSTITNLGDFTFSFFAKFTNISKAINTIFHATNTGGNDLSLEFYGNMVRPVLNTGSYFSYNTTNLNNIWYHFVIKRTGSTIEVFKDNISLGTSSYPTTVYSITGAIILGHEQDAVGGGFDATQSFEGYLSNFKLFNRALTAEEIAIEYNTMFKNEVQIHQSGVLYAKDIVQY